MSRSILVAYSSESGDRGAMDLAQQLADVTGASLSELRLPEHDSPARAVTAAVEQQRPALVVLAAPGGGAAEHVIHGAQCPVVVVPRDYEAKRPQTVGAAFVATPEGHEALRAAVALAGAFGARLRLVTALSPKHAEESEGLLARSHHDHNAADDVALRRRDRRRSLIAGQPSSLAFWAANSSSVSTPWSLSAARSLSCWIGSAAGS